MTSSILSSLLSKPQFVVANAITGEVVMAGVQVKKVQIQLASFIPRHMREDGSTVVDTRVIHSTVVAAEIICPTIDDVEDVTTVMNDRENLYNVTSKGLVFNNMMLQQIGIKQSAEMLSAAPFQIVFKELLQENVNPVVCAQSGDSDTQNAGIQILNSVTSSVSSLVSTVTSNFGG